MIFLKKVCLYSFSIILQIKFLIANRVKKNSIKLNPNSNFTISLTTYSQRINSVYLSIESLCSLQYPPKSISLWLSKQDCDPDKVPNSIKRLVKRGLTVNFVDEDIKSYKKLFYEYKKVKNDVDIQYIVTVDDDVYYPSWLTSRLKESMNKNEVTCLRAKNIRFENNTIMPYSTWQSINSFQPASPSFLAVGVSGIMYPKCSLLTLDQQKENFLKYSAHADDLWFKCLTLHNRFNVKYVESKFEHFPPIISTSMKGLELKNIGESFNDSQFKRCLKYFNIAEKEFQ